jgi:predicted PurR-regulated permease PerM
MDFIITLIIFTILLIVILCISFFLYSIQNQIIQILENQHNELIYQLDNLKNIEQQGLNILQAIDLKLTGIEKSLYVINHNMGLKTTDSNLLILISTTLIIILVIAVLVNTSSTSNEQIIKVFEEYNSNLMQNNLANILDVLKSYNEGIYKMLLPVSDAVANLNRSISLSQIGPDLINNVTNSIPRQIVTSPKGTIEFIENVVSTLIENDEVLTRVQDISSNF